MHNGKIENYNFVHGLHRNMITGKWFPLHPHKLGRALTHDEMDYNLLYSQQTIAGWRIFGQNEDLTLSDNELGNHLIFWKISENDLDYQRYVSAGYSAGQYIWITPLFDCDDFVILSESSSKTSLDQCDNFTIQLVSTTDAIDACASFGVTEEGSTLAIYATPVPTATATPEPTATEVPPTATPVPTATGPQRPQSLRRLKCLQRQLQHQHHLLYIVICYGQIDLVLVVNGGQQRVMDRELIRSLLVNLDQIM